MLDKKITYNRENLNDAQYLKETLENICLYMNEIERIVNLKDGFTEDNSYRLHVLEKYISDISSGFKELPLSAKNNKLS